MVTDSLEGKRLQGYEIQDLIGRGAVGVVYRAYQQALHRMVAIKILVESSDAPLDQHQRFFREAQTLAALEHPHIVPIYDFGVVEDTAYVAMRLLEGGNLAQRLKTAELFSLAYTYHLIEGLAEALAYAHHQGIIHRDIKPANILFDDQNQAYLTDFGLVKLVDAETSHITQTGTIIGTPAYMAPEQWQRDDLTAAADQYAMAIMVFEMLTGHHPFKTDSIATLMHQHLTEPAPSIQHINPHMPDGLDAVLQKGLAKHPHDRFASVKDFAAAFGAVVAGKPLLIELSDRPLPQYQNAGLIELSTLTRIKPPTVVYRLPAPAPDYFHDRYGETVQLNYFVRSPYVLMTVLGRGGMGKTGLVCRFFKALEGGLLPDDGGIVALQGILYLSWQQRTLNESALFEGLCRLMAPEQAEELRAFARRPRVSIEQIYTHMLDTWRGGPVLILMDTIEEVLDAHHASHPFRETALFLALQTFLSVPSHPIKIVMTSRIRPTELLKTHASRQLMIVLQEGLPHPYAERYLKNMDEMGTLGLSHRPDDDPFLQKAREYTRGNPRALEAIIGILRTDDNTTLESLLTPMTDHGARVADTHELPSMLPDEITAALVADAFKRLNHDERTVMQALAVYHRAVPQEALTYLLHGFIPDDDLLPILRRLINTRFVNRQVELYSLHPIDRGFAFASLSQSSPDGFGQTALQSKGADYYASIRKPPAEWHTLDDLAPQLAEMELRIAAGEYEQAARTLLDFDVRCLLPWGQWTLMKDYHEQLAPHLHTPHLRRLHLSSLGMVYTNLGYVENGLAYHEQALEITRTLQDKTGENDCLGMIGHTYHQLGEIKKAIEYHEQALAIARDLQDHPAEGRHLGNLGSAYHQFGRVEIAIDYFQQALTIAQETHDRARQGVQQGNLGIAYRQLGQLDRAVEAYEQALTIARELHDRQLEGKYLGNLGIAYRQRGDLEAATQVYQQALALTRDLNDRRGEGIRLGNLGNTYRDSGRYGEAINAYEGALGMARAIKNRIAEASNLGNLGWTEGIQHNFDKAINRLQQSLALIEEVKAALMKHYMQLYLAEVYLMAGDYQNAADLSALARTLNAPDNNHWAAAIQGIALLFSHPDQAPTAFAESIAAASDLINKNPHHYEALFARALAHAALREVDAAEQDYQAALGLCNAAGVIHLQRQRLDWVIQATGNKNLIPLQELLQTALNA